MNTPLPHPRALAFLGDGVYELLVRQWAVSENLAQSKDLHAFTTAKARASTQTALLHHLKPHLTEAELEIVRQGRNMGVSAGRRADQAEHRQATGLEALFGALYLTDPASLDELWQISRRFLAGEQAADGISDPENDIPDLSGNTLPGG